MADWLAEAMAAWERGDREAVLLFSKAAICDNPTDPTGYKFLGNGLQAIENFAAAERAYRLGLSKVAPGARLQGELLANVGGLCQRLGDWDLAVGYYEQAIAVVPDLMPVYFNWVKGLEERQERAGAIAVLERAIAVCPGAGKAWLHLGRLRCEGHDFAGGRDAYGRARDLLPGDGEPVLGLAHAWFYLNDFARAIAFGAEGLEFSPASVVGWTNYGVALYESTRLAEAEAALNRALALDPAYDDARWALANVWLHRGEWERGFASFEARRSRVLPAPDLPVPEWEGEDLTGKTILIYGQSGLGDMVQFARYLPLLQERGATVKVAVPKPLVRLLGAIAGVEAVDRDDGSWSCAALGVDCFITFLSLPKVLTRTTADIPTTIPYLSPRAGDWQPVLPNPGGLQVGIAWASGRQNTLDGDRDYRMRSCPIRDMVEVLRVPGVMLHGLQVGPDADAIKTLPDGWLVESWSDRLMDLADTAALMDRLDLVIAVDTVVPHLSGALGVPTWILLPYMPNWRWQLNRDDCDWYPGMRLFRQPHLRDWTGVLDAVRRSLLEFRDSRG
ncbi:MAG: tetratricopeptide repeat-containing glycosyltransferase family protein [Cyanobacteria bacterium P01_H01_bin.130]